MIKRLYVNNFRALQNFELNLSDLSSALIIGKNGVGKSTIASILLLLQNIARGTNKIADLIKEKDFSQHNPSAPIRIELEVFLSKESYKYTLVFELPTGFKELRIAEETLCVEGKALYSRQHAQINLKNQHKDIDFGLDWHFVGLPIIQVQSNKSPIYIFRTWLAQLIILSPVPQFISGESESEHLHPSLHGENFAAWFSGVLSRYPAAYSTIDQYLHTVMPDIKDIINEQSGKNKKNILVRFEKNEQEITIDFNDLSDGEKCLFICAVILAANKSYGPLFCFWDEPDNHLSLHIISNFITTLRKSFKKTGQILISSHNPEAIRAFSQENTFILDRKSHLEPTLCRRLDNLSLSSDLIDTLILGDLEL